MNYKVAVCSSDGIRLDVHFGKCAKYYIFEPDLEKGVFLPAGIREIEPVCKQCGHSDHDFGAVAQALSDCKIILVNRIGYPARNYMNGVGFTVLSDEGSIEDVLKTLISHILKYNSENK
ncbi:MAG: hypothetical protein LBT30_06855 [Clostridiales bacterium]|jgi:predicted Fe-Mo cluster-binding NifX family protein|nr:hypothetical protein [Clostridiales bacterium]